MTHEQVAAVGAGEPVNFIGKEILQKDLTILQRNGTIVLRRRGYNVTALPSGNAQIDDFLMNFPEAVWKKSGSPIIPKHTRGSKYFGKPEIEKFMKELPDGAMCEVRCQWVDEEKGMYLLLSKKTIRLGTLILKSDLMMSPIISQK